MHFSQYQLNFAACIVCHCHTPKILISGERVLLIVLYSIVINVCHFIANYAPKSVVGAYSFLTVRPCVHRFTCPSVFVSEAYLLYYLR